MARKKTEAFVFSHIAQADGNRFVPSGLLGLTETAGANVQSRELASEFSYGSKYLQRKEAFELDPVSLAFPANPEDLKGKVLFPANGLVSSAESAMPLPMRGAVASSRPV